MPSREGIQVTLAPWRRAVSRFRSSISAIAARAAGAWPAAITSAIRTGRAYARYPEHANPALDAEERAVAGQRQQRSDAETLRHRRRGGLELRDFQTRLENPSRVLTCAFEQLSYAGRGSIAMDGGSRIPAEAQPAGAPTGGIRHQRGFRAVTIQELDPITMPSGVSCLASSRFSAATISSRRSSASSPASR